MNNPSRPQQWSDQTILENLQAVLKQESDALRQASPLLDSESFGKAIRLFVNCQGKIAVTGVGKSGLIGRKIAATLSSTGTPSIFLHPAEAQHGDLGVIEGKDVLFAIGKSGESEELLGLLPSARRIGAKVIALTLDAKSTLAQKADHVLAVPMEKEACPYDLAPTTSTTLKLALGDAIALTLMQMRDFKPEEFALFHPGGRLGKRLLLQVKDVMIEAKNCPILHPEQSTIQDTMIALGDYSLGIVLFSKDGEHLHGILTDGDLRDLMKTHGRDVFDLSLSSVLNTTPHIIEPSKKAHEALIFMEKQKKPLNVLPVTESNSRIVGLLRLHELLKTV